MVDHVVLQVRDAIVSLLKAGVSAVSNRVYRFGEVEFEQVDDGNTPFIVLQLGDDAAEVIAVNSSANGEPALLEDLRATLFVHAVVKQAGDAEAAGYNLRRDVEATLFQTNSARTLGGKVLRVTRVGAANNRDEALDLGVYSTVLQLEVVIRHLDTQPASFTY